MMFMMAAAALTLESSALAAETEATGFFESDLRVRLEDVPAGQWHSPAGVNRGFERFDNTVGGRLSAFSGDWTATIEGELRARANPQARDLDGLSNRQGVETLQWRLDEATVELWDAGVEGLDLKVGHQVVQWGVGDQFNPTNTLNAENLEDPTKFGEQLPNTMIRADYALSHMWTVSGVFVPIFRPAALPESASIGKAFVDRMPVLEDDVRRDLQGKLVLGQDLGYPTILNDTQLLIPPATLDNAAGMVRVGGAIGMTDLAVSWYTGRTDMPVAVSNHTTLRRKETCHPQRQDECIRGYLLTDAELAFPRMHVGGLNAAGELSSLGGLGWRLEAAVVIPQRTTIAITNDDLDMGGVVQSAGELDYGLSGERPEVVSDQPHMKWTLGLDYTLGPAVYVNAQWAHGMADEFGAGDFLHPDYVTRAGGAGWEIRRLRQGDYLVLGADISLGPAVLRLFSITDLTGYILEERNGSGGGVSQTRFSPFSKRGFSGVLYPELMVDLGDGLGLSVGTVQLLGQAHTKFGDPSAGGDIAFTKLRYSF